MFLQVCVCPQVGGGIPACLAGGIPACLSTGLRGGGGAIPACIEGGIPACLATGLRGMPGLGVCSQLVPSLGGCLLPGGLLLGGVPGLRGSAWGGLVSQHALRQTPPGETTAGADGTHPTGMHSCFLCKFIEMYDSESALLVIRDVEFF